MLAGHIEEHFPAPPARVLDVGGGTGGFAVPLAVRGYEVTVLDSSPAMLAVATQRAETLPADARDRVKVAVGAAEEAAALFEAASFHAACCHDLLGLVEWPERVIEAIATLLAPGGVVSVAFRGKPALVTHLAASGRYPEALRVLLAGAVPAGEERAFTREEAQSMVEAHGFEVVAAYGIRAFAASREELVDEGALADLIALERTAAPEEPYRSSAGILQIICRRS